MLKKSSSLTGPSTEFLDGPIVNGTLSRASTNVTRPSWSECFLLSTLQKFFEIVLHVPDINTRMRKVLSVLSDKQPPCPQFYLYSSADRVIPGECVESFMDLQRSLGRSVYSYNFVSSPHVDHYRSFPHIYSAKIDEFLKICSTVKVSWPRLQLTGLSNDLLIFDVFLSCSLCYITLRGTHNSLNIFVHLLEALEDALVERNRCE